MALLDRTGYRVSGNEWERGSHAEMAVKIKPRPLHYGCSLYGKYGPK